ncbi:unnamed protein product [Ectocarpus sp. 6 AP-2014]
MAVKEQPHRPCGHVFFCRCSPTESCRVLVERIRPAGCGIATVSPCLLRARDDLVFLPSRVLQGAVMVLTAVYLFPDPRACFLLCCDKHESRLWGYETNVGVCG